MPDTSSIAAPVLIAGADGRGSALILFPRTDALPAAWVGPAATASDPRDAAALLAAAGPVPCCPNTAKAGSGGPGWPATGSGPGRG